MGIENNFNQIPNQQETREITREQVIEQIVTNPENVELLGQFIDQLQIKIEKGELSDLEFNKTLAELYEEASAQNPHWRELASDSFYDAAVIANQEGDETLRDELLSKHREFSQ